MSNKRTAQKAALTRAINSKDPERVRRACIAAVTEWEAIGFWPDDWSKWQRALDDAGFQISLDELI